jgi:hypothetical protein
MSCDRGYPLGSLVVIRIDVILSVLHSRLVIRVSAGAREGPVLLPVRAALRGILLRNLNGVI